MNAFRFYYELSDHTSASQFAEHALNICSNALIRVSTDEGRRNYLHISADVQLAKAIIASELGSTQIAFDLARNQIVSQTKAAAKAASLQTKELATSHFEFGRILVLHNNSIGAAANFARGVSIIQSLPGYHKLHLWASLHGRGWMHFLRRELEQAKACFLEALQDRIDAFGPSDTEGLQYATNPLVYIGQSS